MVVECAAATCRIKRSKDSKSAGITFHVFPKDEALRRQWCVAMHRREGWQPSRWDLVCSTHFEAADFDRTGQTVRIRKGVVPTVFPNLPEHLQKRPAKPTTTVNPQTTPVQELPAQCLQMQKISSELHNNQEKEQKKLDHDYSCPDYETLRQKWLQAQDQIEKLQRQLVNVRMRECRAKKALKNVVGKLRYKILLTHELQMKLNQYASTGSCRSLKTSKRSRTQSDDRNRLSKEGGPSTVNKKSVVRVVLTEDETLPGVSKMIPVEDTSAEMGSADIQAPLQSHPEDCESGAAAEPDNSKTNQETSSDQASTVSTTPTAPVSRGFQEYSIKQVAASLLQSQLKIFTCEFCNKIFKFRHSLIAHLRTHTQEKPFQCPHCDYASTIKANLNVHLRKHTGEKFSCQHCSFNCLSPGHLKVHIERVHLKVKQHCSFCQKKYSDVKNLLKHMEKQHNLKDPAVNQSYQQLRLKTRQGFRQLLYHCPTCNRRFKNRLERERHLLVHGPQRPFACLLCDYAATNVTALTTHVSKHFFLYVCHVCEGKFVSCHKLKSHLTDLHPEMDQEQSFTDCINSSYHLIQPGGGMWGEDEGGDAERATKDQSRTEQGCPDEPMREEDGGNQRQELRGEVEQKTGVTSEEKQEEQTQNGVESMQVMEREADDPTPQSCQKEVQQTTYLEASPPTDRQEEEQAATSDCLHSTAGENSQEITSDMTENTGEHEENTPTVSCSETVHTHPTEKNDRTEESTATPSTENTCAATNTDSSSGITNLSHLSQDLPSSSGPGVEDNQTALSGKDSEVPHQSAFQQVVSALQKTRLTMETYERLRKIHGDLECQYCGKLFWYKVHYNVHIRTHTKEHLQYCSQCNYSSITKSSLKRHLIQKHSGFLLLCPNPDCKYTTPDKYKLQAHLRKHQGQGKSVYCPLCDNSYPENKYKQHLRTTHPDAAPIQSKGLMVKQAEKCPYCDSYFLKNSRDFQQHIWAHQGVKPYLCNLCDYAGRRKSNLKTHMNRHRTERCHLCDLCGKKFKSKVTLKSHRLSHTDEGKRFQCSECDFTSVSKPSLLRHMEQHTEFKPFRCAHCRYSCNIAGPLKRHYNRKHPDQKYENAGPGLPNPDALKHQGVLKCPVCEFVYGTKWELNRHLKNKHQLNVVEITWEEREAVEAQFVPVDDEEQLTEAPVAALQDNAAVNILQQITEFSSETHDAVTPMVAMAPGTVAVVEQVADEQEVGNCDDQLMVVNTEEGLAADQVMVVEEAGGLEALTVLTQGDNTHHYIVYVQEQTVEIN
ncbi:zinc finger protein ZFAT isoform X3 [Sphaeramia orbicularis]|uniref:zinc finger protein ZFAT isoform X3 n=1 Tax=Sphaeramia orbicularis TaxID=375764 RepID=UPI0011807E43|nr:zinc finger protein ZFAT isoform X3 [Sphaeramia orbicularis]